MDVTLYAAWTSPGPAPVSWTPRLCRPVLLMPLVLEGQRTEEPAGRVSPLLIVEDFDVVEERRARGGPRGPERIVHELDLERGEEALRHRIVPAVTPPTHAADDPLAAEGRLVVGARILATAVGVMQQPRGWLTARAAG